MVELLQGVPGDHIRITTNPWTEPYWQAAREGRLIAQRCKSCGAFRMPPGPFCPECQSHESEWVELSGRGELFSYTICYRSPFPGKVADFTYAPAVIELPDAGNVRLIGDLVNIAREDIKIGMPVEVIWNPTGDGWAVPWFRPVSE
jgi:uncharacterized OB-fold protein